MHCMVRYWRMRLRLRLGVDFDGAQAAVTLIFICIGPLFTVACMLNLESGPQRTVAVNGGEQPSLLVVVR